MGCAHGLGNGQQAAPWEHETLGRAAAFARLELLGLADDDMVVISDADEVMSRRTVRVLAECHAHASGPSEPSVTLSSPTAAPSMA